MNKRELISLLKKEFPKNIIKAFSIVEREKFVPLEFTHLSYENDPLPIASGSTISQPYTIAFMLNLLELDKLSNNAKILEIGSGSGYVLALIDEILKILKIKSYEIYGIERIEVLVKKSKNILKKNKNIKILKSDGSIGFLKKAPFDRILVSASFERIPNNLLNQLKDKGILVTPVKNSIFKFKKLKNKIIKEEFPGFVFVPVIKD